MGSEQSTESGDEFLKKFQDKYSFQKEMNDPRFQDIQIYKETEGGEGQVFLKSYWCQSEEDYHSFVKYCNLRINNPHKNILKLIGFTQSSENQLCGDFSKITGYFEYYGHNLERELDRRHTRSEFFNEQEIWFLLESIVDVGAYFESQNKVHGDIRPTNIFLTNEGFVKLADPQLVRDDKNAYIKAFQYGEQTYLSPQLMKSMQNREIQPSHNQVKSDVFSLGMTILEVCCLYTARSCYDYGQCQIIRSVVDDLIHRSRARYSSFLINILSELVQESEERRPSFMELQQLLSPYQEQIQNLQPFIPDPRLSQNGKQVEQSQHMQQQGQYLAQSQVSPQSLIQQSQILQQNIQPPILNETYTTSPNRGQTYDNIQRSKVLYQNTSYPHQYVSSQQPQQQFYKNTQLNQFQYQPKQMNQQQQNSYVPNQNYQQYEQQAQLQYQQPQHGDQQISPLSSQKYYPQNDYNHISGDNLDIKVNNALKSTQDTLQRHNINQQQQHYKPQTTYYQYNPQQQAQYQQSQPIVSSYSSNQQVNVQQPQQYFHPQQ